MSNFAPIAGNQYFSVVENVAGAVKNLDLSEGKMNSLSTGSLNLSGVGLTDAGIQPGRGKVYRAVGYSPQDYSGAASSTFLWNKTPHVANQVGAASGAGASVNSNLLLLPTGARLLKVQVFNNTRSTTGVLTNVAGLAQGLGMSLENAHTSPLAVAAANAVIADPGGVSTVQLDSLNVSGLEVSAFLGSALQTFATGTGANTAGFDASTLTITNQLNALSFSLSATSSFTTPPPYSSTNPTQGLHLVCVIEYSMDGDGFVPGPVASGRWDATASAIVA